MGKDYIWAKSVIIDFNHIPEDLGNPKRLKSMYRYYHKNHYCYSYQYKMLRRRKIGLSVLSMFWALRIAGLIKRLTGPNRQNVASYIYKAILKLSY